MTDEPFGELLSRMRKNARLTQDALANPKLNLSSSLIAMLESGDRGKQKPLKREQVWYLITEMKIWPPECDLFLRAAGLATDRSEEEELDIQERYDFSEIWIFARVILDPERKWFDVVAKNITERNVTYRYFTSDDDIFNNLIMKLEAECGVPSELLEKRLECYLLPEETFPTNFAIYNPGEPNMYCCGTKTEHGKAVTFYTSSEGSRLYEWLKKWRNRINGGQDIRLRNALRIFPKPVVTSKFTKDIR